jgi:hypothetical protein
MVGGMSIVKCPPLVGKRESSPSLYLTVGSGMVRGVGGGMSA